MDYMTGRERLAFELFASGRRLLRFLSGVWTLGLLVGLGAAIFGRGPGFVGTALWAVMSMLALSVVLGICQHGMAHIGFKAIKRESEDTGISVAELCRYHGVC